MSILFFPKPSLAFDLPPYGGHKFIWIKNNRAGFTEEQMQKIANNYDLVVIGNGHARSNKDIEHADVKRLKQINPDLPVFLYFPTKLRLASAQYGNDTFQDSWYLRTLSGEYYIDEDETLRTIDITILAYRQWAIYWIKQFLSSAPYDGLAMDNANIIGNNPTKVAKLGQQKIDAINNAIVDYLIQLAGIMNRRDKPIIHNSIGFNQLLSRFNIQYTNGGLDELFCSRKDGLRPIEEQIANIEFQYDAGRDHKILLLRAPLNVPLGTIPVPQYGRYCYGLFLMGHVPGYTFFDLSKGYSIHNEPEILDLNEQKSLSRSATFLFAHS